MKMIIVHFFLFSLLYGNLFSSDIVDHLLSNKWISDKEKTIEWINKHRPTLKNKDKLFELFGQMKVSMTLDRYNTLINGKMNSTPIKIIGNTERDIAIVIKDPILEREVIIVIEVDEDKNGYWTYNSQFDLKENFKLFTDQ
jgi:hypothetical protein